MPATEDGWSATIRDGPPPTTRTGGPDPQVRAGLPLIERPTQTRALRLEEPDGRWSVVELPTDARRALLLAAAGLLAGCPDTDGKARAIALLQAGGPDAGLVAVTLLREALSGAL